MVFILAAILLVLVCAFPKAAARAATIAAFAGAILAGAVLFLAALSHTPKSQNAAQLWELKP